MKALALVAFFSTLAVVTPPALAQPKFFTALIPQPEAEEWRPLTQREQFKRYLHDTFNARIIGGAAVAAAINTGRQSPREWSQDAEGFGQRLGNNLAKVALRETLEYGISSALREDTRYIASHKTTIRSRALYAIASTYLARNREGHLRFATSSFVANAGTAAISRLWAPASWQGGGNMARDFALTSVIDAGYHLAREFGPDIIHALKR